MNAGQAVVLVLCFAILGWIVFLYTTKKGKALRNKAIDEKKADAAKGEVLREYITRIGGRVAGKYLTGHPDMPEPVDQVVVGAEGGNLLIVHGRSAEPVPMATIPLEAIENIFSEDHSTVKERVTASRFLLQGELAYLNKKQEKVEVHYVVVKWKDGRFQHDTIFEFAGATSIPDANALRSMLIRLANTSVQVSE